VGQESTHVFVLPQDDKTNEQVLFGLGLGRRLDQAFAICAHVRPRLYR